MEALRKHLVRGALAGAAAVALLVSGSPTLASPGAGTSTNQEAEALASKSFTCPGVGNDLWYGCNGSTYKVNGDQYYCVAVRGSDGVGITFRFQEQHGSIWETISTQGPIVVGDDPLCVQGTGNGLNMRVRARHAGFWNDKHDVYGTAYRTAA